MARPIDDAQVIGVEHRVFGILAQSLRTVLADVGIGAHERAEIAEEGGYLADRDSLFAWIEVQETLYVGYHVLDCSALLESPSEQHATEETTHDFTFHLDRSR
jgi:hypothetical protein